MTILILLICVSLGVALLFLTLFLWGIRSGQYEDTYTPSVRMLFDDVPKDTSKGTAAGIPPKNDPKPPSAT